MEGFMVLLFVLLFIISAFAFNTTHLRDDETLFLDEELVETIHED